MIHDYPYTDFHELNLDYIMRLARDTMGLHFAQSDTELKLVSAAGKVVSKATINYAKTALEDTHGNKIDAYVINAGLDGDTVIFTKGNGEYTALTIPYARKAEYDVNNNEITSYIRDIKAVGDNVLITYGNGESYSVTIPYAVKATNDENGKAIHTYVAVLSTANDKLIVTDGAGTTLAELTIPYAVKALNDVDDDAIKSTYGATLSTDTTTVSMRNKVGGIISTITVPYATKALTDDEGNSLRGDYAHELYVNANKIGLQSHTGTTLNEITVPFATVSTDATNAVETISVSGDEIVFTTFGGVSTRIISPYAVKALKDNLNNTIHTSYVASVQNDVNTGKITFYAADGSVLAELTPTLDSAIHDSYNNLIADYVSEIITDPNNDYVTVNHGTGDSDTITIHYATRAWKDTYDNVIGNTYIRSLSVTIDPTDNHKYLIAYNGELSELFRVDISVYIPDELNDLNDVTIEDPQTGDVLVYDADDEMFYNRSLDDTINSAFDNTFLYGAFLGKVLKSDLSFVGGVGGISTFEEVAQRYDFKVEFAGNVANDNDFCTPVSEQVSLYDSTLNAWIAGYTLTNAARDMLNNPTRYTQIEYRPKFIYTDLNHDLKICEMVATAASTDTYFTSVTVTNKTL